MKTVLAILLIFLMAGCGYTTRSQVMDKYETIYIRQFQNKIDITSEAASARRLRTNYPAIETEITKAVVDRFVWDGDMHPAREEDADLVLKGEVIEFRRDALRYILNTDEVEEYRISLAVNISLFDNLENKLLWQENNLVGDTTFFTIGPQAELEDVAVRRAVADLSRRIVERVVEDW